MRFDGVQAVRDVSFDLAAGRFLTILGPSGSGKTTLLRMIAGFLTPSEGEIRIAGRAVASVAPAKRSIGMVFQRLALFPHMTAAQNVAFPLRMRRFDARTIPDRVARYLDLVRLGGLGDRRIGALSGGQQQRVAIARALVFEPDLLLLDEPLAALDAKLREEMQLEFRRIQRELGVTTINVTHDQREALVMSDQVIVMEDGAVRQDAAPADLYHAPATPFVARFIGVTNALDGVLASRDGTRATMRSGGHDLDGTVRGDPAGLMPGGPVRGVIRGERIRLDADARPGLDVRLDATVTDVIFEGERLVYEVQTRDLGPLRILHHDHDGGTPHAVGDAVRVGWTARDLHVFAADTTSSTETTHGRPT